MKAVFNFLKKHSIVVRIIKLVDKMKVITTDQYGGPMAHSSIGMVINKNLFLLSAG